MIQDQTIRYPSKRYTCAPAEVENENGFGKKGEVVVPRDRFELPTRGFSVPCSTD